jgi:hypothetical protein
MMERVIYVYSKGRDQVETAIDQLAAQNASSFCKDHHLGNEVPPQDSWGALKPKAVLVSPGNYRGDVLYPGEVNSPPIFKI